MLKHFKCEMNEDYYLSRLQVSFSLHSTNSKIQIIAIVMFLGLIYLEICKKHRNR